MSMMESDTHRRKKFLVIGLGNEIMGDDAAGILAARALKSRWDAGVEILETSEAGLALLDHLEGFDCALILDTVVTGNSAPGTIRELSFDDFKQSSPRSPHVVGLHEVAGIAQSLDIPFPSVVRILTLEAADPFVIRQGLSDSIANRLPEFVRSAEEVLQSWGIEMQKSGMNSSVRS